MPASFLHVLPGLVGAWGEIWHGGALELSAFDRLAATARRPGGQKLCRSAIRRSERAGGGPPPARALRRMAERRRCCAPGLRAVAARRSKALRSSAPPCQISPHAPTRPGSACRNDAGMITGCGEHASGTAAHSQGRSRRSREGGAWVGAGARESRSAARARARRVFSPVSLKAALWRARPRPVKASWLSRVLALVLAAGENIIDHPTG